MVLTVFFVVIMRYLFDWGRIDVQESALYLHATIFMLGAAYTFKYDEHVRVDIFYRPLSPRAKAWTNLMGGLLLLFPMMIFILVMSWDYVAVAWEMREGSREAGGLNGVWLLKGLILVFPGLVMIQGVGQMAGSCLTLLGWDKE
ncbi:MAG: TRAP transporter small permease subunit [Magnetococcales bacterium]|nr:TRAP transporter small permease subunit [Magnetococcales bacterium]MBF0149677.1 TRAP transporter small permease subunit [Magnetococcales bacterium]MBF0173983.1 TRAP transporter small permease subunit [Magnetococcales bacterium]MBF0346643.1 TRAP transporter small permease subunit [Magnetococcales bacterium]MBF0630727.1 TRAP transporter small permease subunit [Magnetococcales bacterium]